MGLSVDICSAVYKVVQKKPDTDSNAPRGNPGGGLLLGQQLLLLELEGIELVISAVEVQ